MIQIDYQDRRPIYQQIIESVEDMALRGILGPNEKLPAVRTLAMELAINPNTIQRAYQELEKMGIIYTVQGKGCFIAPTITELQEQRKADLWKILEDLVCRAMLLDISEELFCNRCQQIFRQQKEVLSS